MDIFEKYFGLSGKKIKLLPKDRELGFYEVFPQHCSKQGNNETLLSKKCKEGLYESNCCSSARIIKYSFELETSYRILYSLEDEIYPT